MTRTACVGVPWVAGRAYVPAFSAAVTADGGIGEVVREWRRIQRTLWADPWIPRARTRAYCAKNAVASLRDGAQAVSTLAILSNGNGGVAQFVVPFSGVTKVSLGARETCGAHPMLAPVAHWASFATVTATGPISSRSSFTTSPSTLTAGLIAVPRQRNSPDPRAVVGGAVKFLAGRIHEVLCLTRWGQ